MRRDRGIALLLTLLVLTILIVLIAQMSVTAANTKSISQNYLNDLQNGYGARSGYHQAVLFLETDGEKAPNVDHGGERWAKPVEFPLGRANVRVEIQDSPRRINLSLINNDDGQVNAKMASIVRRLVYVLGHDSEVGDRIVDYIDGDTKGEYEIGARNARLHNLEELLRIDGIPREALYGGEVRGRKVKGVMEYMTLWPRTSAEGGAGAVNANTAPVEVLMALSDKMSQSTANAIVAYRETRKSDGSTQSFESVNDLRNVSGVTDELLTEIQGQIAFKASHFEIRVRSSVANVAKSWLYVVKRTTGEKGAIALVTSQKTSDFLAWIPPAEEK